MRNNGKKDAFSIISIAVALLMIFFIGSALISVVAGGISYIPEAVKSEEIWFSVKTSLITATISTALCVFISIPSSYAFTRTDMPFRRISELIMELMMCLPYIVLGLCLLILFSSEFGKALKELGFQVVFDVKGIVIAQFFVNFPYAMKMVKTAFMQVDRRLEIIAGMLGASKWKQLTTIILPLSRNALISMIVLVWSRAIGDPSGKHISQYIDRGYGNGHGGGDDNALHCDDFSYGDQPTEYYAEILPAEWSRMK